MAVIVVGGNSRNIGKTSVVAGLVSALPDRNWTAVKITQDTHGVCPVNGSGCDCRSDEHTWAFNEESDPAGKGDTSRFLQAGARRAFWFRIKPGHLADAVPTLQDIFADAENTVCESNSLIAFVKPDLYLFVLDLATADFKASARQFLPRADAIVMSGRSMEEPTFLPAGKAVFRVSSTQYLNAEIVEFVRKALRG